MTSESPEFDHLLHCVPGVASAVAVCTAAGLPAHTNPPYLGFQNGAWRLDVRYVEILGIVDRDEVAGSPYGRAMTSWMPVVDDLVADGGGVELVTFATEGSPVSFRETFLRDAPRWAGSSSPTPPAGRCAICRLTSATRSPRP